MTADQVVATEDTVFSLEQVKEHTREEDCWLVIDGHVYDVTKFLDEHPGGFDIIIANTGKDASEDFEEIGHSNSAKEMLQQYKIGKYKGGKPSSTKPPRTSAVKVQTSTQSSVLITALKLLLPFVVLAAIFLPKLLKTEST